MVTSSTSEKSFLAALHSGLPEVLPEFIRRRRWFGGKARTIHSVELSDIVPLYQESSGSYLILAKVRYTSGQDETYHIPLVRVKAKGRVNAESGEGSHNWAGTDRIVDRAGSAGSAA